MSQGNKSQSQINYSTKSTNTHSDSQLERITDSIQKKLESIVRSGKRFRKVSEIED